MQFRLFILNIYLSIFRANSENSEIGQDLSAIQTAPNDQYFNNTKASELIFYNRTSTLSLLEILLQSTPSPTILQLRFPKYPRKSYKLYRKRSYESLSSYWLSFQLKVNCRIIEPTYREKSSILKLLNISVSYNKVKINYVECSKGYLFLNISVSTAIFKENEYIWRKQFTKNSLLYLNSTTFRVTKYIDKKSTILTPKINQDFRRSASTITYITVLSFTISLSLVGLFFSIALIHMCCHMRRATKYIDDFYFECCTAYDDPFTNKLSDKLGEPVTDSLQARWEERTGTDSNKVDIDDELYHDLREFSTFKPVDAQNLSKLSFNEKEQRGKVSKSKIIMLDETSPITQSNQESSKDECSRDVRYFGDPVYLVGNNQNLKSNIHEAVTSSTESLGLTKITFIDGESPSFRIETDF